MKREAFIDAAVILLLIAVSSGFRLISLSNQELLGSDSFYHYSVLEQSLADGRLSSSHSFVRCYAGVKAGQPLGFYAFPYLLSRFLGIQRAFGVTPVVFGTITIILVYLFLRHVFGMETAVLSSFLVAVSHAHAARSSALTYRGDNIACPFLIFSLLLLYLALNRKSALFALLAGLVSGISAFFWSGFPIILASFDLAIAGYLLYLFSRKGKMVPDTLLGMAALLVQFTAVLLVTRFLSSPEKIESQFAVRYYPWALLFTVLFLCAVLLTSILRNNPKLNWAVLYSWTVSLSLAFLLAAVKFQRIKGIVLGYGILPLDSRFFSTINELQPLTLEHAWFLFWLCLLLSPLGILLIFRSFRPGSALFIGASLPLIVAFLLAIRFSFLASIPLLVFAAIAVRSLFSRKLFVAASVLILVSYGTYSILMMEKNLRPIVTPGLKDALLYFGENSEEKSCMVTFWDIGEMVPYYSRRYAYTSSSGGQDYDRIYRTNRFYLTDSESFSLDKGYILASESELGKILELNRFSNVSGIGVKLLREVQHREIDNATLYLFDNMFMVVFENESVSAFYSPDENTLVPVSIFVRMGSIFLSDIRQEGGCVYMGKQPYYFNRQMCESNFARMLTFRPVNNTQFWYANDDYVIYRLR